MLKKNDMVLGLDTSNYTTSLAVIDGEGNTVIDKRKALSVKQGERGLRQSHALFQHIANLPEIIESSFSNISAEHIKAIAASNRPRPVDGSYMPVFNAGLSFGRSMASCLSVPLFMFSHQEGHIAAASYNTSLNNNGFFLAFHLSGGTCELLSVKDGYISEIGRSKDISFGQVLDRIGVLTGMSFPAGNEMDMMALSYPDDKPGGNFLIKPVPFDGMDINLSGLETQAVRLYKTGRANKEQLAHCLLNAITECLIKWTEKAVSETGCDSVLYTGGVASSNFIRKNINDYFCDKRVITEFGQASLSTDNAVGIALLGRKTIWQLNL